MTTPTNWRALCAELVGAWIKGDDIAGPMVRARYELARPEPQGPTDAELIRAYQAAYQPAWERGEYYGCHVDGLRAVLARWGRPAIEPVSVSERLPGPEDCDAEGQCWLWRTDGIEEFWELVIPSYNIHEYNWTSQWKYTHWLPHWALPVPGVEGGND
jgi:hypothetical protein